VLENPAISIVMTVQNSVVTEFLSDSEMSGTGMTARFLYAFCEEKAGTRKPYRDRNITEYERVFEAYNKIICGILKSTVDVKEIKTFQLSDDAFLFACDYFEVCEKRILSGSERAKGWAGKCFGLSMRIAGLFHCFECFELNIQPENVQVTKENVSRAAKITDCLSEHAEKAFSPFDKINGDAIYLLKKIKAEVAKKNGNFDFSKTEILRMTHGRFKKAEDLVEPLTVLKDLGYITSNFLPTGGHPVEKICVNPCLSQS
jgi:hypothetical protein